MLAACNALTGADSLGIADGTLIDGDGSAPDPEDVTNDGGAGRSDGDQAGAVAPADDAATPETSTEDASGDALVDAATPPEAAPPCVPASVGPRYGTSAFGATWTEDNGILAPDNSRAHSNGDNPNPIVTSGFGFALPANAEVRGIRVVIARNAEGNVSDGAVRLPKGVSKANGAWPAGPYSGPFVDAVYGSSTDLWGTTWTAADINASSFGVSLIANGPGDGHVDSIAVTVHYCAP